MKQKHHLKMWIIHEYHRIYYIKPVIKQNNNLSSSTLTMQMPNQMVNIPEYVKHLMMKLLL